MQNWIKGAGIAAAIACAMPGTAALAEDLALIISNERYDNRGTVSGMSRSVLNGLKTVYERDGFTVTMARNAGVAEMRRLLADFEAGGQSADRLVVHFTGHVIGSGHNLRLVPADLGRSPSRVDQAFATVPVDLLYELLDHRPGKSALILATPADDARDSIARGAHIPNGLLVMVGGPRQINRVLSDGFFDDETSPAGIRDQNTAISMLGFVSDVPFANAPQRAEPRNNRGGVIAEMADWRRAANAGTRDALRAYLRDYPRGMFVDEATARLDALGPEIPPEQEIENALNLTRSERREIQRNLTLLGHDTRGVDGIFGGGTRRAVAQWQKSERFRETGYLDRVQIRVLGESARIRQEDLDRKEAEDKAAREEADLAYWRRTGASGEERDLQDYLERYPDGLFAAQARRLLIEIETARVGSQGSDAAATEEKLGLNNRTRKIVEQRLATLGINPGPVDGTFDRRTRHAIAEFQRRKDLEATGYLTNRTVGQLIASVFGR